MDDRKPKKIKLSKILDLQNPMLELEEEKFTSFLKNKPELTLADIIKYLCNSHHIKQ